jgi:hypothetical protein
MKVSLDELPEEVGVFERFRDPRDLTAGKQVRRLLEVYGLRSIKVNETPDE